MENKQHNHTLLQESYGIAEEIMKQRAKSFYLAFSNLPNELFLGVAALYAFCRHADDTVDFGVEQNYKEKAKKELDFLESQINEIYNDDFHTKNMQENNYPWWSAFYETIKKYKVPKDSFLNQIKGQRQDLDFVDIQTQDSLIEYSRLVAGSVGTMMMPLLISEPQHNEDAKCIKACENLGVAMQITNILRDVGEDLRLRNRVYLPAQMLANKCVDRTTLENLAFCDEKHFSTSLIPTSFINVWEELADLADKYYLQIKEFIHIFNPVCRFSLMLAALSYQAIADEVRKQNYNCFTKRCYINNETKELIIKKAYQLSNIDSIS